MTAPALARPAAAAEVDVDLASDASLRRFLHGLPGVDQVGLEARASGLGTRSIKTTAKAWALDTAISMVDLTTLEGADTPARCGPCAPRRSTPTPPTRPARGWPRSAFTTTWPTWRWRPWPVRGSTSPPSPRPFPAAAPPVR